MYQRGNRWYSDFWYQGERYVKTHGPVSKTVAKEKDRSFRADVAAGDYIKKKMNPPFDVAIKEHLNKCEAENQPSTLRRYKQMAEYLKAHFGSKRVRSIEGNEILMRQYISKRKDEIRAKQLAAGRNETELSYTSINRELALLRAMFNVLIKAGKVSRNPVSLVTLFEEVQKERILTFEEEDRIMKTIDEADVRYQHLKDMVTIALNTGMRQGEIFDMKKSWIDLKEGLIIVPRFSQKRKKKDKRVPINSAIRPIIKRLMRKKGNGDYLFINPKTGTRFTKIQNSWNGILKKAKLYGKPGVDKLRFHDLRHTAATNLARNKKDMKFIAQYLGHSDVRTSARYVHYSDQDLKEGAETLVRVPSKFTTPKNQKPESLRACSSAG